MSEDVFGILGSLQDGAFRVREVVAEGGFAVVYRAYHEAFRSDVALKCLKIPGALSEAKQTEFLEKFRAEGEILFRLSAAIPAVVRPLHLGTLTSPRARFVPFIALEWLEGLSLAEFIRRRVSLEKPALDLKRAVELVAPAARALEQAHRFPGPEGTLAILHRDLKPENLFVATVHGREALKVLDFGIGKVKSAATQIAGGLSADQSSLAAFTPAYGAPEQWLPKRFGQTGTWTDVWGLALTLVEVVSARSPLEGDAHALVGAALDEVERPTPRVLGVVTSDQVEAIFRKALAVDPRDRYHDIGEFWDELEQELGVATTRLWATPATSLPPGVDRVREAPKPPLKYGAAADTLANLDIPDLDEAAPARAESRRKPSGAPPPAFDELDDLDEPDAAEGGFAIPSIGGFRMDAPGSPALEALELSATPAEIRERPVAQNVALIKPRRASLFEELSGPLKLLVLAACITAADWGYTAITGTPFQFGGARAFWLSAPLALYAILKIVLGLLNR